jgi:N-acetyl sugar amidotransferase
MSNLVVCKRCVVNSSVPGVSFDTNGHCNHCSTYDLIDERYSNPSKLEEEFNAQISEIKKRGRTKTYDCIVGLSGGVDSSFTLLKAVELGLRPLVVHFDNGWNSDKAVKNIKKIVSKLDVDLYTYVIDWQEFRDLQLSFLKASVPDAEIPTDIAIKSVLYDTAVKQGIKYILYSGSNHKTEGRIPKDWTYMDGRYIKSVQKIFGNKKKLRTYPNYTLMKLIYYHLFKRIKLVRLFNYIEFENDSAINQLKEKLEWEYYGGKHYESLYTKFFQSYILPVKHKIDKRLIHYSALVRSGQLTRNEALKKVNELPYNMDELKNDKEYVCKKLEISEEEFEEIMNLPIRSYRDYKTYDNFKRRLNPIIDYLKEKKLWPTIA